MAIDVDERGIIKSGRFAGYNREDVLEWADAQAGALPSREEGTPPSSAPQPPAGDPASRLAADAAGRVDKTTMLLAAQQEAGDEASFAATVHDYDKPVPGFDPPRTYRSVIADLKKTMPLEARIGAGLHRRLYSMIKLERDTDAQGYVFRKEAPVAAPPTGEEEAEAEAAETDVLEEPVAPVAAPPATPPKVKPKAAPPSAPSPGSRSATPPPAARKPKLVATEKVRKFCRASGLDEAKYLMSLEDRGITQDQLQQFAAGAGPARPSGRRSVYDHTDE